jgi:hypothetical protein
MLRPKLVAIREMTNVRRRKSNASSVQPRKLAMKVLRAADKLRSALEEDDV